MKHVRLFCTVLSLTTVGGWAVANACENDKSSQTSAASYSAAASKCTAAQAAACKSDKVNATTAAAHGACTAEQAAACKAHGVSATTASMDHCAGKTTAATAGLDHCAGKSSAAMAAAGHCNSNASAAAHSCGGAKTSSMAMAGGHCNGQGIAKVAYMSDHTDCDACVDMTSSAEEIDAIGATSQMVPLKNGVMFVYTTDSPSKAHAVQAALARRSERMAAMTTAGDRAHLCSECKAMRGAAASGKLNREVVNIEGGCLTLMTSNDPRIVAKIHSMVGAQTAARVKL